MNSRSGVLFDVRELDAAGAPPGADEDLRAFLSTPLAGMSRLALFGERCAALQALDGAGAGEPLREYLRRRIAACDAQLGV